MKREENVLTQAQYNVIMKAGFSECVPYFAVVHTCNYS